MVTKARYTVDEFESFLERPENGDRLFELIDGEIVEKLPTEDHGSIVTVIAAMFYNYKQQHNIKGHVGVEVRHQAPADDRNSYLPDVSFRFTDAPRIKHGAVMTMPDVAFEIQSDHNSLKVLRERQITICYTAHGWCGWFCKNESCWCSRMMMSISSRKKTRLTAAMCCRASVCL